MSPRLSIAFTEKVTCPHCHIAFIGEWSTTEVGRDPDGKWTLRTIHCAACSRLVAILQQHQGPETTVLGQRLTREVMVWPRGAAQEPLSPDVPDAFANDYREACLVLFDSPKASAALSRRCLQHLLREKVGAKQRELADQIQHVLDAGKLPEPLANDLDAVRNIGNFAAHPMKSTASGEILDVEPGEAEWGLAILEGLFDFYFVQPAAQQRRRDALNAKLADAKKPPMKAPPA